jgi:hypothetical protein
MRAMTRWRGELGAGDDGGHFVGERLAAQVPRVAGTAPATSYALVAAARARPGLAPPAARSASADVQALDGLPADLGYDLEVLIEMQNREASEFRGRCDDEVRYGRAAVLSPIG